MNKTLDKEKAPWWFVILGASIILGVLAALPIAFFARLGIALAESFL